MKLVRDRIPELAAATGPPGSFHQASEAEFARWLRAKLLEEAGEAATASPAGLAEELGDVLQVLYALAATAGLEPAAIECARARKARTHGAYTRRLIWQPAPGPAAPTPSRRFPVREHDTSVHLMLDPDDASELPIEARQPPDLADTFYLTLDSLHCRITLSGPAAPLLAVVERMRAELVATLAAASHADLTHPAPATPASKEVA